MIPGEFHSFWKPKAAHLAAQSALGSPTWRFKASKTPTWRSKAGLRAQLGGPRAFRRLSNGFSRAFQTIPDAEKPCSRAGESFIFMFLQYWLSAGLFGSTWRVLGASWALLGGSWAPLGLYLGVPWANLGATWVLLGPTWGLLGRLEGQLGPSFFQLGGLKRSKTPTWRSKASLEG